MDLRAYLSDEVDAVVRPIILALVKNRPRGAAAIRHFIAQEAAKLAAHKAKRARMTVNGRIYEFTLPADSAAPKLLIVVGGMGQGKSSALAASTHLFLDGLRPDHVQLGSDALKEACVTFNEELAAAKSKEEVNKLKKRYQPLIKKDQAAIVAQLMSWKLDIVCEFANEDNLYDLACGISKLFPSLEAISEQGYKLRLMSVQCLDSAENIIVGTNSRKGHLGTGGCGMQKWIVSKGCLIRSAFFLDSLKHLFRAESAEGTLVDLAVIVTRDKWDSETHRIVRITSRNLLQSAFVTEASTRLSAATSFKEDNSGKHYPSPYDGDTIPSAEWQQKCDELEHMHDWFNMDDADNKQVGFTEALAAKFRVFYGSAEVQRLLAHEAEAQRAIRSWGVGGDQ